MNESVFLLFIFMTTLSTFIQYAQLVLLILSMLLLYLHHNKTVKVLLLLTSLLSLTILAGYACQFKIPPFVTMWHTLVWFVFLMTLLTYFLWSYTHQNMLCYGCCIICIIFIINNLLFFQITDHALPPALKSVWFVPHVTAYLIAYGLMGVCFVWSVFNIITRQNNIHRYFNICFNVGYFCLLCGLFIGCIWAKNIWGNFWSWDSKETFALLSALLYTICLKKQNRPESFCIVNIIAFAILLFTWIGTKYLYTSQSLHIYG